MKLTTISIKNFRSFDDHGEIIKIGNLAAFVGKNSSGKSNILQALQLFWGQSILTEDDFYYRDTERTISISAEFLVSSDEIIPSLLNYISPNRRLHLRRDFTFSNQKGILISLGKNGYNGIDEMNPFPSKKLSSSKISSFLSSPNSSDLLAYAENLGQTITEQNFYQILESYWCAHFTEYSVHWTTAVADIPTLQQKNIFSILPSYYYLPVSYTTSKLTQDKHSYFQQIYQQILGDVNQLLSSPKAESLKQRISSLYRSSGMKRRCNDINSLLSKTNGADSTVTMHIELGEPDYSSLLRPIPTLRVDDGYDCDIQGKGQGIQRDAIFRLLNVFSSLNKKKQKHFILAVDEPEAFMHPTYKRSLFKSFLSLCSTGCQVIYTTHDPAFVSVSRFDDIHTVTMVHSESQYSSVHSSSLVELMQKEVFKKCCHSKTEASVRNELEHKCRGEQNEGFFADRIILVEGSTESYALPIYFSKLGYDLDEHNTVILCAKSKTLLQLLCTIFSSCEIPCYCIFDGDKPLPSNEESQEKNEKLRQHIKLNRNLLTMLHGIPQDFPDTTVEKYYTIWEHDFEHAIQMQLRNYETLKSYIIRTDGVPSDSKPLVAYHLAQKSTLSDFPPEIRSLLTKLIEKINSVSCLPLIDSPVHTNIITLSTEETDDSIPVYSSAAGRNTFADTDTPNNFAIGSFPPSTSFLVHIQGDSMEKEIPDGCYVAVKRTEEWPRPGTIAIFCMADGEMVCKRYIEMKTGEKVLRSLNSSYRPIPLTEDLNCRIRGEVIMLGKKQPAIFFAE